MNILLIFFAIPLAVIIFSVVLQKILKCPILVASVIFAILVLVTFIIGDLRVLVLAIIYTILAFIVAFLTMIICRFLENQRERWGCNCGRNGRCRERNCDRCDDDWNRK